MKQVWLILMSMVLISLLSACNSSSGGSSSSDTSNGNNGVTGTTDLDSEAVTDENTNTAQFILSSPTMSNLGDLPVTYTCDGNSVSPPLSWTNAPEGTQEYALVMHHVPGPGDVHWYWVMYNISSSVSSLSENEIQGLLGTNSVNGLNEYAPPCSKGAGVKSYTFTLYALSGSPDLTNVVDVDRAALLAAIDDITLQSTSITVNYERYSTTESTRCDVIKNSVSSGGFSDSVSVACDDEYAYITSDTYPDHDLMNGITGTNEQIPVPAEGYSAPIKLEPQLASSLTTIDAAVGVAINGVPIYDYSSQGDLDIYNYDPNSDTYALGQLDNCGGHAGRGDDYHYHKSPNCMIDSMPDVTDASIIGWGYDGFPLYGNNNPDGSTISEGILDFCNGQYDSTYGYRYHTSEEAPYIIQCLVGEVDTSILPRVAPLSGDTTGARANLEPPYGGVENLTHSIGEDGSRTMTYIYNGANYYVTYTPSTSQSSCYDFEQKTVSNGGILETGTFCRGEQTNSGPESQAGHSFKLEVWADNWFTAYLENELIIEDSVSITTERSFNAESTTFSGNYPLQLNFIMKDFKENDTGLEYIGTDRQQMGDGGFIAQVTDTETNQVIAVSNAEWKCEVLHQAPLNKSCENEANPIAGVGACDFISIAEPSNWKDNDFDDSSWANATEYSAGEVGPKDGYNEINWDGNAKLIWGSDLETDNTLICRVTINET